MALDEAPEGVKVECYVDFVKIGSTCTADETVPVQIYINLLWRDDRHPNGNDLGYKTPEEAADNATDAPESAWRPLIGVSNIESDWVSEASPVTCGYREPSNDGPHNLNMFVFYHCVGTLSNPMNLKNFPFDSDTIEIHLDPSRAYQVGLGSLQPHGHKAGTGISFFAASVLPLGASAEWKIYDVSSVSSMGDYGFPCPQLRLYLHCARNPLFYLQKPILLLFILTNFMFLCFVLDPIEDFNDRINYLLTNILATSAFLFGIGANLPTLPYLTVFDQLIMTSFVRGHACSHAAREAGTTAGVSHSDSRASWLTRRASSLTPSCFLACAAQISAFIIGFETAIANMLDEFKLHIVLMISAL